MGGLAVGDEKRLIPLKKFNMFKQGRRSHLAQNFLISLRKFDPQFDRSDYMSKCGDTEKGF